MSALQDLVQKKLTDSADMEQRAKVGGGVGQSVISLAPVVAGEMRSVVKLKLQQGILRTEWEHALAAVAESDVPEEGRVFAAVASLLLRQCGEAEVRIAEHGKQLVGQSHELLGEARGIATTARELLAVDDGTPTKRPVEGVEPVEEVEPVEDDLRGAVLAAVNATKPSTTPPDDTDDAVVGDEGPDRLLG